MKFAAHDSVLPRLSAAVQTPPFEPTQDTVLTPGPEGRLVFPAFRVLAGVKVSFQGGGDVVTIVSRGDIVVDGTLDTGGRSLTLDGQTVTFGATSALTGGAGVLNVNSPIFDPGSPGNLRGNVVLNGARLATGEPLPGESDGSVAPIIGAPIVVSGNATILSPSASGTVTLQQPGAITDWSAFELTPGEATRFTQGGGTVTPAGGGAVSWVSASTGRIELRDPVGGTVSDANSIVGASGQGPSSLVVAGVTAPPAPFRFASLEVSAVPEPGAWALLLGGAAALFLLRHLMRRDR